MTGPRVGGLYQDRVGTRFRLLEVLENGQLRVGLGGRVGVIAGGGDDLTLVDEGRAEAPIVKSFPARGPAEAWARAFDHGREVSGFRPLVVEAYEEGWVARDPGKKEDGDGQRERAGDCTRVPGQDRAPSPAESGGAPGARSQHRPVGQGTQRRTRSPAAPAGAGAPAVRRLIDVDAVQDLVNPMVTCAGCKRSLRERDSMVYKKRRLCADCL